MSVNRVYVRTYSSDSLDVHVPCVEKKAKDCCVKFILIVFILLATFALVQFFFSQACQEIDSAYDNVELTFDRPDELEHFVFFNKSGWYKYAHFKSADGQAERFEYHYLNESFALRIFNQRECWLSDHYEHDRMVDSLNKLNDAVQRNQCKKKKQNKLSYILNHNFWIQTFCRQTTKVDKIRTKINETIITIDYSITPFVNDPAFFTNPFSVDECKPFLVNAYKQPK